MLEANILFWLLVGHAVADYALQSDFMAQGKSRHTATGKVFWPHLLTAHALIHGGAVALATGSVALGMAEVFCHWLIDFGKCENRYGLNTDQALHIACKLLWAAIVIFGGVQ